MVYGNGVKNIQAAAYNGARTMYNECHGQGIVNFVSCLYITRA